ncbi:Ionotropic receptor 119 [Blattella germanica]|nr:Ionotropic receptor 119 [Blattella germanica]
MSNVYTWLIMLTMCVHGDCFLSMELQAELIYLVQRRIQLGCLTIIQSSGSGIRNTAVTVKMQKILITFRNFIQLKIVLLETYNYTEMACYNGVPPMYIILHPDENVKLHLKKILNQQEMSRTSWLMFFDSATPLVEFFSDIYVPFSCTFLVAEPKGENITLTEVYRVAPGKPLLTNVFGNGSSGMGYILSNDSLYERRNTLHGLELKGVSIMDPPITELILQNGRIIADGYLGDIWVHLEKQINFTTHFLNATADGQTALRNTSWNGMINMLHSRQVDIALSEFTLTVKRLEKVDYTIPLSISTYQLFIRDPKDNYLHFGRFLEPFSLGLWLSVLGSIMIFSVLLALFHTIGRNIRNAEHGGPPKYRFRDTILYMFGTFCMQGHDFTPRATSCRIIYITAYITSFIVLAAYSSVVISFAATRNPDELPFTNLEGLYADKSYKLIVTRKSAMFNLFDVRIINTTDQTMSKLFERDLANIDNLPLSDIQGIKRACSGKYAFMSSKKKVMGMKNVCDVVVVPGVAFPATFGMGLAKHSPYKGIIDFNLLAMKTEGIIQRIRYQTLGKMTIEELVPSNIVDVYYILPIMIILITGALGSILLLGIEVGWHRYQNYHSQNKEIFKCRENRKIDLSTSHLKTISIYIQTRQGKSFYH